MTLLEALNAQQVLIKLKSEPMKASTAFKVVKIVKAVDNERDALIEALEGVWEDKYKISVKEADKETLDKLNESFIEEAKEVEVEISTKLTQEDLENVMLTVEEALIISKIMED